MFALLRTWLLRGLLARALWRFLGARGGLALGGALLALLAMVVAFGVALVKFTIAAVVVVLVIRWLSRAAPSAPR